MSKLACWLVGWLVVKVFVLLLHRLISGDKVLVVGDQADELACRKTGWLAKCWPVGL